MQRFLIWLRSWFALRRLTASDLLVKRAELRVEKLLSKFEKTRRQLLSLSKKHEAINNSLLEDLDDAIAVQKQLEEAMAGQQSELKIMRDVTLPTLIAQDKLVLQTIDANLAVQVRRQVAASPGSEVLED